MSSGFPRFVRLERALVILVVACAVALGQAVLARDARADDPYRTWWTLETPHFHVTYYKGLEPIAEKIAAVAEGVNERLGPILGWEPKEVTEIVVTDDQDDANGSATALPYNTIRLYATAPDDLSPLGEYDDWYGELVTHEYTHILHTDHITGAPAIVNGIFGKMLSPNQTQPRWVLEGLAVMEESLHTGGGRNRSAIFDMFLRADVLEKNLAPLDQVSHQPRRWPQGNLWYLYGSRFLTWISDTYGESTMREVADDAAAQLIPWSINRSVRRATGRTYEELYEGWSAWLSQHYAAQVAEASVAGLREGTRLTHSGQTVMHPKWVPDVARTPGSPAELLYFRDDGHTRAGFYRLPLITPEHAQEDQARLVVRTAGNGSAAFEPEGGIFFNAIAVSRNYYALNDLFRVPRGVDTSSGFEPERARLTTGARAQDPDVSPDGKHVVFTENHRGTMTLAIADRRPNGELSNIRALVPSARFEQAYTPRFSPDGKKVAYSAWTYGGYRDVRIVDVATGRFEEVTHDRAFDVEPSFSRDGRYLFFSSDRAYGIPNIFAFEIETKRLRQVTNVRTGAFSPEMSPDEKTLAYVGYTSDGFDLYSLRLSENEWLEPPPYVDTHPEPTSVPPLNAVSRHPYNPLQTLRPRSWLPLTLGPGTFGNALSFGATGTDVVGHHQISATILAETQRADPQFSLSYAYTRLPFTLQTSLFRSLALRGGFRYSDQSQTFVEHDVGVTNALFYSIPDVFESHSFGLSYSIYRFGGDVPLTTSPDPYALVPIDPPRGYVGTMHIGWAYSNAERYLYSVGPERGFSVAAGTDIAAPALASDYTVLVFSYSLAGYFLMPWAQHHSLALHAMGAISGGNYPYEGLFATGGFVDTPVVSALVNRIFQGGFVLRGYAPGAFVGSQFHLYNAEYRFPILNIDHGLSTLPFFIQRLSGSLFADYGGAFNDLGKSPWKDNLHLGVGGELWLDLTVTYLISVTVRFGYAKGLFDDAALPGGQTYTVIAAPF